MKKFIFTLLLLSFTYLGVGNIKPYKSFDIIKVYNNDYAFNLDCITSYKYKYNLELTTNDMAYSGIELKNFKIMAQAKYKNTNVNGVFKWEDPDYIITKGKQVVRLLFKEETNNKVISIDVFINGNDELKKSIISNYDKKIIIYADSSINLSELFPKMTFTSLDGDIIDGTIEYSDYSKMKFGINDITWVFTPYDSSYELLAGTIKIYNSFVSLN